jgi:CelD/BcsL family acetyltransferase involved in cellulose biosynthesis
MAGLSSAYEAAPAHAFERLEAGVPAFADAAQPAITATGHSLVEFSIVRDRAGFEALAADWNELFARCGEAHQLFQTYAWNWHWAKAYLDQKSENTIAIMTGRRNGRLVTLWPMTLERRGGMRELSWMGEPVSQYGDILIDAAPGQALEIMTIGWAHLCHQLKPDLARLRKVRSDARIAPLLTVIGSLKTSELEAPYIDLTRWANFAAYEERFPKRAIRNRRRQMRRLEEAGAVEFKHLPEGREASQLAAKGIELKRAWLIDRGHVSPALADARMGRFMEAVALGGGPSAATRVSALASGGKEAGIQIGFTCKNTRALHVIVYDRAFEKMAAGVLHLEEAIRQGFAEGLTRIDLLAPKAEYKVDWADGCVGVTDHAIGMTVKGKAYARIYLGYLRARVKSTIERMPHKMRQMLVTSHLHAAAKRIVAMFGFV